LWRLESTGATANCLYPGFVATRFADESGGLISRFAWFAKFFAISPAEGAQTIIYLASSPEVTNVTGKYFYKCRPTTPSTAALDDVSLWHCGSAVQLWQAPDRSTSRSSANNKPNPGNFALPTASHVFGATRARCSKRANCWLRCVGVVIVIELMLCTDRSDERMRHRKDFSAFLLSWSEGGK
jgi:hypothetical protein